MGKKVVYRIPKDFYFVSKRNRVFIDKKKEESSKICREKVEIGEEESMITKPDGPVAKIGKSYSPNLDELGDDLPPRKKYPRTTPDWITELKDNEVFVFGSNEAGRHGAGAAKLALKWGAIYGQAFGLQGKTFAIPTMNSKIIILRIDKVKYWVDKFIDFAKNNPDKKFYVTEIGCGLAGFNHKQIAPLFKECSNLQNVYLPREFWRIII